MNLGQPPVKFIARIGSVVGFSAWTLNALKQSYFRHWGIYDNGERKALGGWLPPPPPPSSPSPSPRAQRRRLWHGPTPPPLPRTRTACLYEGYVEDNTPFVFKMNISDRRVRVS